MDAVRESWTDERLDDLNQKVGTGFARVDAEIRALRLEMRTEFTALRTEMKAGFERVDERFDERFDALHRLLIQFCGVMLAALVGVIASLAGVLVTQL